MATLTATSGELEADHTRLHDNIRHRPRSRRGARPAAQRIRRNPGEAAERARIRTVVAIVAGVLAASFILAAFLLALDLIVLGGIGITLTILLFGIPFWVSAIEDAAERAHDEALAFAGQSTASERLLDGLK